VPHYRIIRRLAIGGMAEVFLGKVVGTAGFEKPVAIKRMLPAVAADPKSAEAFLREARLCVHLVHPNVVQVLDLGLTSGQPYLVMELVDGEDLRRVIVAANKAGQPLQPSEAVHIACCVAEALAYAHEATGPDGNPLRVVHRDVNPSNVLVSMRGEVKLADFGVAKAADGGESTQGNLLKGKIGYLAPELLAGAEASHASDIFLAGTLLYELLAGKPLFPSAGSAGRALAAIAAHDETRLELPASAPPELHPVLRRALARAPAARHPHARDLARDLHTVLEDRRWRVSREDLARRMANLFAGRPSLDRNLGEGIPLRDDRDPGAPAEPRSPAPKAAHAAPGDDAPAAPPLAARTPPPAGNRVGPRKRLGELLVGAGLITETQLQTVLARQRLEGGRIGEWVVSLEYAPARSVLQILARQLGVPYVTDEKLLEADPPADLLVRLPQEVALRLLAMPMADRDGSVFVAMTDPADLGKLDLLRFRLGPKVRPVVATEFGVRRAIARLYGGRADDLKWRQLDPSDPRAMVSGRMIDFDAVERERLERERVLAAREAQALPATPAPAFPWNAPAITPAAPAAAPFPAPGYGVPPAYGPGGYAAYPLPAANPAFPPLGGPGYAVAYVQAGVGPDGQPIYVAVPSPAAPVSPVLEAEPPAAVVLPPVWSDGPAVEVVAPLAGDEDLPVAVELAPLDDDDTPERPEPAPAGELLVAGAATVPAAPSDAPASERKPR
jgi:serine/threonine-protein kinase